MDIVRGLAVWLAPALLASLGCTIAWHWSLGGEMSEPEIRITATIVTTSLPYTLGGSALLALVFAWSRGRGIPLGARYGLIVATGSTVGIALMAPLGTSELMRVGFIYGLVTALCWITLHRAIYRR